jgi:hypothetical protein
MKFKLNSLSGTNPKAFWDLVNELKYEIKSDKGTNLDAPTWENYFKKLNTKVFFISNKDWSYHFLRLLL